MRVSEDVVSALRVKFEAVLPHLDERSVRLVLAGEARSLGYGGLTAVAQASGASGASKSRIAQGMTELESGQLAPAGRVRREGGGRKPITETDPGLLPALLGLVEPTRACLPIRGARVIDAWVMLRIDAISDDLWTLIEPVLPSGLRRGRPWNDHRHTLEAIVWRFRTGSPWRDLPEQFGSWQSVWERHHRWSLDGTYARIFAAVRSSDPHGIDDVLRLVSIDSTSVRAHQHAAGARPARDPLTGGKIELQDISR